MPPIPRDVSRLAARRACWRRPRAPASSRVKLRDALPAEAQLTATDLNPPMLDLARAKFRPGERVSFQPADATALPFADASFDAIVCQFGLMFFPDKAASFSEARRVLAPGGRYVFSVWDSHRHNPFGRIAHEMAASLFPGRSAAVLQCAVLLPPDRSDQGAADDGRLRQDRHRRDQTGARAS